MEKENDEKRALRSYKLSKSKYFNFTVEVLELLKKHKDRITLEYDKIKRKYVIKISDIVFCSFLNGTEYNKIRKNRLLFSVLWAFSNLNYKFLRIAYEKEKPINIELMSRYYINRFIRENKPQEISIEPESEE